MISLLTYSVLVGIMGCDEAIVAAPQLNSFRVAGIQGVRPASVLSDVQAGVSFVTLDDKGKRLAHVQGKDLWVWDLPARKLLGRVPYSEGNELWRNCEFLSGGKELLVCRANGRVISYDVETLKVAREWNPDGLVGTKSPHAVMTSLDGIYIGVAGKACALWRADAQMATLIPTEPAKGDYSRFGKFVPNGKEFVIVGDRGFQFFTVNPLRLVQKIEAKWEDSAHSFEHFAWSANPRYFVTSQRGWLTVWDRQKGAVTSRVRAFAGGLAAVAFMNGGKKLIAVGENGDLDGRIYVWDTVTGQLEKGCVMIGSNAMSMAISPDEKTAYFGTAKGVQIYDLERLPDLKVEKE